MTLSYVFGYFRVTFTLLFVFVAALPFECVTVSIFFSMVLYLSICFCHIIPSLQVTFHLPAYRPHTILHWQIQCRHRSESVFHHRDMKRDTCFSNHTNHVGTIISRKLIGARSHMYGLEPIFVISSNIPKCLCKCNLYLKFDRVIRP